MGLFSNFINKVKKDDEILKSLMDKDALLRLRFGTFHDYRHIHDVSIILNENEYCFFKDKCSICDEKEEIAGYKSQHDGVNFRVTQGLSYRTGGSKSNPIKKTKEIEYDGVLYLTNKRVIYVCEKFGFDKKISDITSIQGIYSMLNLQIANKTYRLSTPSAEEFLIAFNEVCMIDITKLPEPKETPSKAYDGEIIFESGKVDPLYYLVGSGLIKTNGHFTYIYRKLNPIQYRRMYNMVEDLIKDNVIIDEIDKDGKYKVIMTYEEWLNRRITKEEK